MEQILVKENIVIFIIAGRIIWFGHVQRMDEERIFKQIMHARMEKTRKGKDDREVDGWMK